MFGNLEAERKGSHDTDLALGPPGADGWDREVSPSLYELTAPYLGPICAFMRSMLKAETSRIPEESPCAKVRTGREEREVGGREESQHHQRCLSKHREDEPSPPPKTVPQILVFALEIKDQPGD